MLKSLLVLMTSGFIEGYDLGMITFANLYLKDRYFLSLGSLGAAIGALISGPIVDRFGRRPIVLVADVMYLLGGSCMCFYKLEHGMLYFGRLLVGLAIGVTSMNVPIYISEIVPNEVRGRFVAWYTFLVVAG
jgi:MFS family permease